jgi:hypothetical protein
MPKGEGMAAFLQDAMLWEKHLKWGTPGQPGFCGPDQHHPEWPDAGVLSYHAGFFLSDRTGRDRGGGTLLVVIYKGSCCMTRINVSMGNPSIPGGVGPGKENPPAKTIFTEIGIAGRVSF